MEYLMDFLDRHNYIFPVLCILIIALLIAIIISLLIQIQKYEAKTDKSSKETPEEKRTLLTVAKEDLERQLADIKEKATYWERCHAKLTSDYAELEKKHNAKTKECTKLNKKLKEKNSLEESSTLLQKELDNKTQRCTELELMVSDYNLLKENFHKLQEKDAAKAAAHDFFKNKQTELENTFKSQFLEFYTLRNTPVMTENESKMFQAICDEICRPEYQKIYESSIDVFPQMSLHSVFALTSAGKEKNMEKYVDNYFSRKFISKSVDFLLCRRIHSSIDYFQPILGIEIDGTSHSKEGQRDSDDIKNMIFKAAKLPLLRFPLPEDKCTEIEQEKLVQEIRTHLL